MEIKKAVRRALPFQIGMYGPTGSGKTLSALLVAAGLIKPGERVCVIDTERGRASLYSDNKRVLAALPDGYDVLEIDQPYHPNKFIEAIDQIEQSGYRVCIVDSESDSWDGPGGCSDIAEQDKGRWNKAKLFNKRMKTRMALSDMHFISLYKAQEKSRIIPKHKSKSGKEEVEPLGVLPICEKNAFYPFLVGFSIDPGTHLATTVKCIEALQPLFSEPKLLSKEDGARIREWNETGRKLDDHEQLKKRARAMAEDGILSYKTFFEGLPKDQQRALRETLHEELKMIAETADRDRETSDAAEPVPA